MLHHRGKKRYVLLQILKIEQFKRPFITSNHLFQYIHNFSTFSFVYYDLTADSFSPETVFNLLRKISRKMSYSGMFKVIFIHRGFCHLGLRTVELGISIFATAIPGDVRLKTRKSLCHFCFEQKLIHLHRVEYLVFITCTSAILFELDSDKEL